MPAPKDPDTARLWRKRISETKMGHPVSAETRAKMSRAARGRRLSEECKRKISEAKKGQTHTEETRRKIGEAEIGHRPYGFPNGGVLCKKGHPVRSETERIVADSYYENGIEYEYEPEGFSLGEWRGRPLTYWPDFYLPGTNTWVEVKNIMSARNKAQLRRFARDHDIQIIMNREVKQK